MAHPPNKKRRLEKRERKRRQSLDGDGTWRRTSGERRTYDRRRGDQDEAPIIHLPFLDGQWGSSDGTKDEAISKGLDTDKHKSLTPDSVATPSVPSQADTTNDAEQATNQTHLGQNPQHIDPAERLDPADIEFPDLDSTLSELDDSGEKYNTNAEDSGKAKSLTIEEQARLESLKNMLDASNARYKQASKNRRPAFTAGLKVKVIQGDQLGKTGVVLDADYIANRALISLPEQESPRWIGFRSLGHAD